MTKEKITELHSGFHTAFINGDYNSNLAYRPQFVYNDNKNGQKVFSSIEDELLTGKLKINGIFSFNVAFQCKRYKGAVSAGVICSLLGRQEK